MTASLLNAISFDPEIRGIFVVLVGTVVLVGSVFLILATNVGARVALLVTGAGLFGWMALMGIIWTIYGIGLVGRDPAWTPIEINLSRETQVATEVVRDLPPEDELPVASEVIAGYPVIEAMALATEGTDWEAETLTDLVTISTPLVVFRAGDVTPDLRASIEENAPELVASSPEVAELLDASDADFAETVSSQALELRDGIEEDLGGWCLLAESDARRGEAVAASDAALAEEAVFGDGTTTSDYIVGDVFIEGGKESCEPIEEQSVVSRAWNRLTSTFQFKNPELYSVVTVVKAQEVTPEPGEAPPPPEAEAGATAVSTVMLRNLGNRRLIPFVFTLVNLVAFGLCAWQLHHRDKIVGRHLEEAAQGS